MTALIVEDMPQAVQVLQNDLAEHCPDVEVIGTAGSIVTAAKFLRQAVPDVIFLGILLGVGFNFLSKVMGHLGALYRLPPPLAAGLPTLLLIAVTAYVLWKQEKQ